MRHIGGKHNDVSPAFYSCNRGKESISLDLKSEEGKKILLELAADADVFIQNFRPGAIERMGFGEDVLRATNKKLIYVSISGFGEGGPTHKSGVRPGHSGIVRRHRHPNGSGLRAATDVPHHSRGQGDVIDCRTSD